MWDLSYIIPILIGLAFLGLVLLLYLHQRQKRRLQLQRRQLREQNFALKKVRIINEIAARIGAADRSYDKAPPLVWPHPGSHSPPPATKQPVAALSPPEQANEERQKMQAEQPAGQRGNNKALNHLEGPVSVSTARVSEKSKPRKMASRIKTAQGPIIANSKDLWLKADVNAERGQTAQPLTDFHLNMNAGLYEQLASFSTWIAEQSELFTIEPKQQGSDDERIYLFLTTDDLERRNGHWFDLFQPPNFKEITKLAIEKGGLYCPFDEYALDKIIHPARKIIELANQDGSSRYRQVLRESALEEFVNFLEKIRGEIASQEA